MPEKEKKEDIKEKGVDPLEVRLRSIEQRLELLESGFSRKAVVEIGKDGFPVVSWADTGEEI